MRNSTNGTAKLTLDFFVLKSKPVLIQIILKRIEGVQLPKETGVHIRDAKAN